MRFGLGPVSRTVLRGPPIFVSLVLEVAIGLAVVSMCLSLAVWFARSGDQRSGLAEERIYLVEAHQAQRPGLERALSELLSSAVPGVEQVASVWEPPLEVPERFEHVRTSSSGGPRLLTWVVSGGPGLAALLELERRAGRDFEEEDFLPGAPPRVIVTEGLSERLFGGGPALGRRLWAEGGGVALEVVGVVSDFCVANTFVRGAELAVLWPARTPPDASHVRLLVRVDAAHAAAFPERAARVLDAGVDRWVRVRPLSELRAVNRRAAGAAVWIMLAMIGVLAVVAVLGYVGMASHIVVIRRRQIGIMRALGAARADVVTMILTINFVLTSVGLALGLGVTVALHRASQLFEPTLTLEPGFLLGGMVLFWATGVGSTIIPAIRASRIPPAAVS